LYFAKYFRIVEKAMTTCNKVFLDSCINVEKNQTFLIELNEFIQEALTKVEKDNVEASASKCKTLLNKLFEPIEARMNDCFVVPGGYGLLKPEIDRLKMNYLEVSMNEELGPCKGKVLKDFEDERVCLFVSFFLSFFLSFLLSFLLAFFPAFLLSSDKIHLFTVESCSRASSRCRSTTL